MTIKKTTANRSILLPVNDAEFEKLVDILMDKYGFTDYDHVAYIVGHTIQRLPVDQDRSTLEYFGACIRKSMSYSVARRYNTEKLRKAQIDEAFQMLKLNTSDKRSLDFLMEQSTMGSEYASQCLDQFEKSQTEITDEASA